MQGDSLIYVFGAMAAFFVGASKGGLPMVGILGVPLLAQAMPPVAAAALLLPIYIVSDRIGLWMYRHEYDGRNLAILVEIAARNQLLRARGHHAARKLADKLEHQMQLAGPDDIDESEIEDLPDTGDEQ